jgi:pyruvate carboxylase
LSRPPLPPQATQQVLDLGTKDRLSAIGPKKFSEWMRNEKRILLTDTTMRDAHQSLFATRMRTDDMVKIAPHYAQNLSQLFSLECWGGATFDVSMRFLNEDPWERLKKIRAAAPNILLQMLLRSSNAVGYTNYPDNVVRFFITQAAQHGIDVFRVFDSLNWVENMRVAMDAVIENNAVCEATICYTGDIYNLQRAKYNLKYYVNMAKELEKAGAHIIGIKDMAGICRPLAITALVQAIKDEVGLPVHFHTHDTSGASIASVLAAIEAGVDAVDGAMDSMSGLTSQPSLGGIIAATEGSARDSGISLNQIRPVSSYWEGVRKYYSPFEADIRSGTSDVYLHEMPGGQYTNLREQARSLGIEQRWPEVSQAYADVNQLFGDIVKVTPSSKVVGDMALYMVTNDLTPEQVLDPAKEINFPESVISLFRGEMGYPADGFPKELGKKILKDKVAIDGRAGAHLPPTDLEQAKKQAEEKISRHMTDTELASYLMYPKVFTTFADHYKHNGDVSLLPTPVFFYGLNTGEEIAIEIDPGKTLVIRLQGTTPVDEEGVVRVFFELNGQPRTVKVKKKGVTATKVGRTKADADNVKHVAAPLPGMVATIAVKEGQQVQKGQPLVSIEAMKMETMITANDNGVIKKIHISSGNQVDAKDLLIEFA